jgi:hypothetical protein
MGYLLTKKKIALVMITITMCAFAIYCADFRVFSVEDPSYVNIHVDCSDTIGEIRSMQGVNTGPAPSFPIPPRPNIDLSYEYLELGVDCVRIHDFYGPGDIDEMFPDFSADPQLASNYNFTRTDYVVEKIKAIGAEIIFRLGYSWPEALGGSNVTFIKESDHGKWAQVAKHIIMHYNDGWADGFHYNIKYWEVWNEPDHPTSWTGTLEQYFKLYETVARVIKAYDPHLKVGGPAAALNRYQDIKNFIDYCAARKVPLDFVSWHHYYTPLAKIFGNPSGDDLPVVASKVQGYLDAQGLNCPQLLTEWDLWWSEYGSLSKYDFERAVYACSSLIRIQDSPIVIANYYRGDAHWSKGLFNETGDLRKPAYAFKAFKTMLETPIRSSCTYSASYGYAALAGKSNDNNRVAILISNYNETYNGYNLTVDNLPWKVFKYERYLLDETHDLALVESGDFSGTKTFGKSESLPYPSFQLIILTAKGLDYKECVGEGFNQVLFRDVTNPFNMTVDAEVSVYYNDTLLETQTVTLDPYERTVLRFYWGTSTWSKGTYGPFNITAAYVDLTTGYNDMLTVPISFKIVIRGDVNGDGIVNIVDVVMTAKAFGSSFKDLTYYSEGDINCDGIINIIDLVVIGVNFGKTG